MISPSEIQNRAIKFQKEWAGATYERGEAQTFWNEFFEIFGISHRRVATFEEPIKKLGGKQGFRSDTERVAHLFELNQKLTSLITEELKAKKKK